MTTIYIDADACPVKEETVAVARAPPRRGQDRVQRRHTPAARPAGGNGLCRRGAGRGDDWIAERIGAGDLCITADIPLAARCVKAGARVLKPDGTALEEHNIGAVLATRNLMADLREQGSVQSRHAAFGARDRSRFREALERVLRQTR